MSQRNLPASFWRMNHHPPMTSVHNSSGLGTTQDSIPSSSSSSSFFMPPPSLTGAQPPTGSGHDLYGSDPYHHPSARYPMHHQNDPWHYTLSSPASTHPYTAHHHHRSATSSSMHELGYSSASNRFNAQYSPLLLQPSSMRSTRLTPVSGACSAFDKSAPDMSWLGAARYHHDAINFAGHHSIDANYTASAAYGAAMSAAMSGKQHAIQTSINIHLFKLYDHFSHASAHFVFLKARM